MAVDAGLGRDQFETGVAASLVHDVIPPVRESVTTIADWHEDDDLADEEGGVRAWLAILGSFLVYFASFGTANSFGYFQSFYQTEYLQHDSPSVISFIGTIQITLLYLTGPVTGALFDTYGLRVSIAFPVPIDACVLTISSLLLLPLL
jgi:hypothetical protein